MKCTSLLSLALVITLGGAPAFAQTASPAAPAASAASAGPMDCGMSSMKRHDHGAERNTGATASAMAMPCHADESASAPAKSAKKAPAHDHAKFHKNQ